MNLGQQRTLISAALGAAIGAAIGIGAYTFVYAKGGSYMTDNPSACANCHVMNDHYSAWLKSSHRSVAVCNDCHTPSGFVAKYSTKASNGFWHSYAFTTGDFKDPLRIKPHNLEIANEACRKCHEEMTASMGLHGGSVSCVSCHQYVGHME